MELVTVQTDCLQTSRSSGCLKANKSLRDKAQERCWSRALRCRDRSSHAWSSAGRLQRRRLKNSSSWRMWRGLIRTCRSPCFYSKFHFIHVHLSGAGNAHLNNSEISTFHTCGWKKCRFQLSEMFCWSLWSDFLAFARFSCCLKHQKSNNVLELKFVDGELCRKSSQTCLRSGTSARRCSKEPILVWPNRKLRPTDLFLGARVGGSGATFPAERHQP